MPSIDNISPSTQSSYESFSSTLGGILHNPLTKKVSRCVRGLVKTGLWAVTPTYVPEVTFSVDGSVGIVREALKISYLAIEGGGFKGFCYPPFIKTLNDKAPFLKNLKEVAGTSAGAMMSFMIASGTPLDEIDKHLANANISKELGGEPLIDLDLGKAGFFSGNNMIKSMVELSIKAANKYYQSIKDDKSKLALISDQRGYNEFLKRAKVGFNTGLTFGDLKLLNILKPKQFKLLNVVAFDQTNRKGLYFNAEDYPDVFCHVAVRASMAIPIMFRPVLFEGKWLTDGGDETNIPLRVFSGRVDYDPEETMALVFERNGSGRRILYDPPQNGFLSGIKIWMSICNRLFHNTINGAYFKLMYQSFAAKLDEWKKGKKDLKDNKTNTPPSAPQTTKFRTGKPSIIRWIYGGERYLSNRNQDANALYALGPNVLVVPHGEGKNILGTADVNASPAKIKAAQQTAVKAAEEYAKWREGIASYKAYENTEKAISSLTAEEKKVLTASVKRQLSAFFIRYDNGETNCSEDFFSKHHNTLNAVVDESYPNMHNVFAVLKFLQTVN
ncbi:MAG: patatin-like phospholipase family protein [Parachlamydiaceae bacterium]|nr:patatin-like phospholipase family protein [Parachlamydiaceae bacterium]